MNELLGTAAGPRGRVVDSKLSKDREGRSAARVVRKAPSK